jgi:hypothetical protein
MEVCKRQAPPNIEVASNHIAACWLHVDPAQRMTSDNGLLVNASEPLHKESKKR